jgi:hypothetical protein
MRSVPAPWYRGRASHIDAYNLLDRSLRERAVQAGVGAQPRGRGGLFLLRMVQNQHNPLLAIDGHREQGEAVEAASAAVLTVLVISGPWAWCAEAVAAEAGASPPPAVGPDRREHRHADCQWSAIRAAEAVLALPAQFDPRCLWQRFVLRDTGERARAWAKSWAAREVARCPSGGIGSSLPKLSFAWAAKTQHDNAEHFWHVFQTVLQYMDCVDAPRDTRECPLSQAGPQPRNASRWAGQAWRGPGKGIPKCCERGDGVCDFCRVAWREGRMITPAVRCRGAGGSWLPGTAVAVLATVEQPAAMASFERHVLTATREEAAAAGRRANDAPPVEAGGNAPPARPELASDVSDSEERDDGDSAATVVSTGSEEGERAGPGTCTPRVTCWGVHSPRAPYLGFPGGPGKCGGRNHPRHPPIPVKPRPMSRNTSRRK